MPALTLVQAQSPLPRRITAAPDVAGISAVDIAAGRAAMAATAFGFLGHIPVMAWNGHTNGPATAQIPGGGLLAYTPGGTTPFLAYLPCSAGATHKHIPITTHATLAAAQHAADTCGPQPRQPIVVEPAPGNEETQPISVQALREKDRADA